MREYLASQANVNLQREFYLLAALGEDLPGALKIKNPLMKPSPPSDEILEQQGAFKDTSGELHFSLAGVQLKFSAIWDSDRGVTIPLDGVGGAWIVKLPSPIYAGVTENEYVMMELARHVGIEVPKTALLPSHQIHGLPKGFESIASDVFIIKRFDRDSAGKAVHIEDFAQIFGIYPEQKYRAASYRNIAEVIWSEIGEKGIEEFIRRFVFNALIGNGDMHLKNWSLIYPNEREPALAPAYDFVSTISYLPGDDLALTFVDSKKFSSLSCDQFKRFAAKAHLPETLVLDTARDTVKAFAKI